LRSLFIDA